LIRSLHFIFDKRVHANLLIKGEKMSISISTSSFDHIEREIQSIMGGFDASSKEEQTIVTSSGRSYAVLRDVPHDWSLGTMYTVLDFKGVFNPTCCPAKNEIFYIRFARVQKMVILSNHMVHLLQCHKDKFQSHRLSESVLEVLFGVFGSAR